MNIIVSDHAYARAKDRCGIPKKSVDRIARKAFESGVNGSVIKGMAAGWIESHKENHNAKHIYVYGDKAWIFADNNTTNTLILVTVLTLPTGILFQLRKQIA